VAVAAIGLGGLTLALAGDRPPPPPPVHYRGLLNDYTPSAAVTTGGPYEMRGKWTLDVDPRHGTAKFSAEMNMETSDYGITQLTAAGAPSVNKDDPTTRGAHTHHISMTDGVITTADWMTTCPKFAPPVAGGFVVTGTAFVTGNGGPAPFGNPSPLTLCVLGGTSVKFSNLTMTFGAPATKHFGIQAIHGVVVWCASAWELASDDCSVQE
jgi:hypothetical protein